MDSRSLGRRGRLVASLCLPVATCCPEPYIDDTRVVQSAPGSADLNGVILLNHDQRSSTAIVVGDGGTLLYHERELADDSWKIRSSGVTTDLNAVAAVVGDDDSPVFVAGAAGTLLRGAWTGDTWESVQPPDVLVDLYALTLLDRERVIAVGDGVVLLSEDSGDSWSKRAVPPGIVLRAVSHEYDEEFESDRHDVVAVGDAGAVIHSADSGRTWRSLSLDTSADLIAIASHIEPVKLPSPRGFSIVAADGPLWIFRLDRDEIEKITLLDDGKAYRAASADGYVLIDTDGSTWFTGVPQPYSEAGESKWRFNAVDADSNGNVVIVGDDGVVVRMNWVYRDCQ